MIFALQLIHFRLQNGDFAIGGVQIDDQALRQHLLLKLVEERIDRHGRGSGRARRRALRSAVARDVFLDVTIEDLLLLNERRQTAAHVAHLSSEIAATRTALVQQTFFVFSENIFRCVKVLKGRNERSMRRRRGDTNALFHSWSHSLICRSRAMRTNFG